MIFSVRFFEKASEVSKKIENTSYKQREIMDAEIQATKYAIQKAAATLGKYEVKNSAVTIKNLETSAQETIPISEVAEKVFA